MPLRPSRPLILAVLVAALLFAGFKLMTRPKPVPVLVAAAAPGRVETTVANTRAGSVAACKRAKLAPPAGGRIARLPVKKGQRVQAGELLLELWNDDLAAREQLAREQLGTARARVNEVCQLARASASEAHQARQLRDKGFISEERVVRIEAQAASGQASCDSTRAQIKEAEARIAAAHADTQRTVLRAPFAGIVAEINGELGEYLTPSPPGIPTLPAVDLIDDSCLYVTAPIDEVDAASLQNAMPGRITLDAYRGKHFPGHLRRIAPYVLALEKQARTVEVEVEFDQPPRSEDGGKLLVGYSADIEVVVEARENVLRIPTSALMPGNRVLVLKNGRLEERKLEIGLSNWEYTEVKTGLAQDEQVVTSLDREGVKAGASVVVETKKQ
ncbi:efflux RND transporter periplasmic adaptor subunit [Denitratisoma oestradiolicum]|uniref:Efflux transporter periplasmic adaptor subunit n=1 Tax=Denitratisoma oestradiolicum TaxID=311182 RepID=A0A6S6XQL1_9PROT|nr:efflux RND transporter periplasmic adaptor subunit [Denitratisoma oestradiolicum]TWO78970.1 efflux transporter periplasmic adaptor subunit [Denitratisoma oestradiolicum]CAB1368211.1 Efflux transporter periplasmic adaptor subunit [Denitratisoma oestradiolicum]